MVEAPLPTVPAEVLQPAAAELAQSESAEQVPWQAASTPAAPEAAKPRAPAKQAPPAKQAAPRPPVAEPAKPGAPERPQLVLQQLPAEIRGPLLEVCSHTLAGLQQQAGVAEGQHVGRLLPRGLQNSGNLCFMNATLQVGRHCGQVVASLCVSPDRSSSP